MIIQADKEIENRNLLKVAAVQFPLSGSINRNFELLSRWMSRAAGAGAELVQFPETALTGYYRVHVRSLQGIDRDLLAERNRDLRSLAGELGIWLVYGSTHFEPDQEKPFNSLYLINPHGQELCRYDKIFLTDMDQQAYAPGNRLTFARIKEFRIGLAICFDMRFPELFRRYMDAGVNMVLISSYQSGGERADHMSIVSPATLITRAAENGIYLSCSNTSERPAWHEAMVIGFNGAVRAVAKQHRASMALAELDASDFEPFTNFIRKTARSVLRNAHPVTESRLIEEVVEVF